MKIDILGLLTIILFVLKMTGSNLSWTMVFAPLWIPALFGIITSALFLAVRWWISKDEIRKDD